MPEGCPFCPLSHWTRATNEFAGCNIVPGKRYAMLNDIAFAVSLAKSRPDWCPIVEIPPHSRLTEEPKQLSYGGLAYISPNDCIEIAKYFSDQIKAMPTIIEAEESKP